MPGFAVFSSFTLRVNETAAELASSSQRLALLTPGQIGAPVTRHARSRAAGA